MTRSLRPVPPLPASLPGLPYCMEAPGSARSPHRFSVKTRVKQAMDEVAFLGIGLLVGGALGWVIGAQRGARRVQGQVVSLLRAIRTGKVPSADERFPGEIPALGEIRSLLANEWAPIRADRAEKTGESAGGSAALERVAEYLKARVSEPLSEALQQEDHDLRAWIQSVLDAVEDMRFFLESPPEAADPIITNLVDLVGEVTQEFSADLSVRLTLDAPPGPLRVKVDPEPLKDALFLIFHNASEFGEGGDVDLSIRKTDDSVHILIRDHGPGFSAEALIRAMDPFYSTTPSGLGLGLPYARMAVKAQGGELVLRNSREGGAEVEIVLPQG